MASYQILETDAARHADDLVALWARNLPVAGDPRARLRWLYEDAPAGRGRTLLLTDGAAAVGCAGIGERRFLAAHGGAPLRAAVMADLAVDREHRTLAPALKLVRAARERALAEHDFAYGFPNQAAVGLFKRAGYKPVGEMARWARLLRHGAWLTRRTGSALVGRVGGAVLDSATLALSVAAARRGGAELRWLHRAAEIDARFDELARTAAARWPLLGERSAAFLRWRFMELPGPRAQIATLSRGEALVAYAVVDHEGTVANVRDFLAADDAALGRLLERLCVDLYRGGSTSVSLRFLGGLAVTSVLVGHRFVVRQNERTVVADGRGLPASAEGWYITDADEDA